MEKKAYFGVVILRTLAETPQQAAEQIATVIKAAAQDITPEEILGLAHEGQEGHSYLRAEEIGESDDLGDLEGDDIGRATWSWQVPIEGEEHGPEGLFARTTDISFQEGFDYDEIRRADEAAAE